MWECFSLSLTFHQFSVILEVMADGEKVRKRNESKAEKKVNRLRDSYHGKSDEGKSKCDGKSRNGVRANTADCPTPAKVDNKKLAELAEAFHILDFDRDGIISFGDLKKVYASLDRGDTSDEQITQMIAEGVSPLDFEAFVKLMGFKTLEMDDEDVLVEAFSQWDYGTGFISAERMRHDLMTWGDKFTREEADAALKHAPIVVTKNKEKMIDYVQFSNDLCGFRMVKTFLKEK